MLEAAKNTADFLQIKIKNPVSTAIILGSGLGNLTQKMEVVERIPYTVIPNFPQTTVQGHKGYLYRGRLNGVILLAMQGRFHYYEGYTMGQVIFPVRVLYHLGVQNLIVSNAAGGINPDFKVGDIMLITDHINLFPEHPLRGPNDGALGPRFVDMHEAYSTDFIKEMKTLARRLNIGLRSGVYVGTQGPTYETPAEYRYMKTIGGDAVGMSTVPEVIAAAHMGMKVLGLSAITDMVGTAVSHEAVQKAAQGASARLEKLVSAFLPRL
ncbi:MAG: purine-nucleoside phosphorylase [Flavobacteriales bacterium]